MKSYIYPFLICLLFTCKNAQKTPKLNTYEKQLVGIWQYDFGELIFSAEEQKLYHHIFITYKADKTYFYTDIKDTLQGSWEIEKKGISLYLYETSIKGKKNCYKFYEPIQDKLILLLCNYEGNQRWKRVKEIK